MELSKTKFRKARTAKLAIRCCPVQRWSPVRLGTDSQLQVVAVYADEVDYPNRRAP